MEETLGSIEHRKRKRRRRADRIPLPGWLQPVDDLKGDVAVVASDFFDIIFQNSTWRQEGSLESDRVRYIAVAAASSIPQDLASSGNWNLLAVRSQTAQEEESLKQDATSLQVPANSVALQSFAQALQTDFSRKGKGRLGIEVGILDVAPIALDTVIVDLDGDLLDKHDEIQQRFSGGFVSPQANGHASRGKAKAKVDSQLAANGPDQMDSVKTQDHQLTLAVREALGRSQLVRQNDMLVLPLPPHPITHVSFPPAKITFCEPVNQGLLSVNTRIVIHRTRHQDPTKRSIPSLASNKAFRGVQVDNGNDTSNEQFYSAAEDDDGILKSEQGSQETTSETESSDKGSESSSDESLGEMISLKAPSIPTQPSGVLSSRTAATPRPGGSKGNGTSTPGSIFSSFTATTGRHKSPGGSKTFQARGLMSRVPDRILHPKPTDGEDDDARIFVDIRSLLKLGCFSGDWVKVQATTQPKILPNKNWGFETPSEDGAYELFKPAKIYGLPNLQPSHSRRYTKPQPHERRSSFNAASMPEQIAPIAWMSPMMLANLGQPSSIYLSAVLSPFAEDLDSRLASKSKVNNSMAPPLAKELTLLRVATPLSTERSLQTGLFAALKRHFESRRRVLQRGDLIALPVDASTSRLISSASNTVDADPDIEQLITAVSAESDIINTSLVVAWFKVGSIVAQEADLDASLVSSIWGGATTIESMTTRMRQVGTEQYKLPTAIGSTWEYYLGIKPSPKATTTEDTMTQYTAPLVKDHIMPLRRRLRELIAAATSPRAVRFGMDPVVICLHSTQRRIGKAKMVSQAAADLGLHVFEIDAFDIIAEGAGGGDVKTEGFLRGRVDRALTCGPACTVILLRHIEVLTADRMIGALRDIIKDVRVLVTTTTEIDKVPDGIRSLFSHELESVAPDEGERKGILQNIIQDRALALSRNVDISSVAVKTAALVAGNLVDTVERACFAKQERLENLLGKQGTDGHEAQVLLRDLYVSGGDFVRCLVKEDFDIAVEAARKNFADAVGAPKIPNVSWDDVGGLKKVKEAVLETIQLPLERPELFAKGMKKRSGILFYGPPGTGKTLLAKAIATEFSLNFFSVKGPELLNMYIGESEANVRRVFQRARDARPCVVFFDELDSVAPKRGNQGDSGGVMDRIVSQLLAELDGMSDGEEGAGGVFVVGATNRPDLLDQALLRPGRFDKMLYLGISDTHEKQLTILEALTRKFTLRSDVSLRRVAESLPFTYTGADLYALCSDAMLKAITRQASAVDEKIATLPGERVTTAYFFDHLAKEEDIAVTVTEDDFHAAQKDLVGSVSAKELEHYQRVRATFEGPSKPPPPSRIPAPTQIFTTTKPSNGSLIHPTPSTSNQRKPPKGPIRRNTARKDDPKGKGKGKEKATTWDSDDEVVDREEDEDEVYLTSNDGIGTPERKSNGFFGNGTVEKEEDDMYR